MAFLLVFVMITPGALAKKADGITVINNTIETQPALSWEELQAWAKMQKIYNEQKINDSVYQSYLKQKANGSIPVVNGCGKLNFNRNPELSSENLMSPLTSWTYYTNDHDYGYSYIGYSTGHAAQDYSDNMLHSAAYVVGGGAGGVDAWGWTGSTFTWNGPTGIYQLSFSGYKNGYTTCYGAYASANTQIDYVVKDNTDLSVGPTHGTDYTASVGGLGYTEPEPTSIQDSLTAQLVNGHTYSVYLQIDGQAIVYGVGEAQSNFHDMGAGLQFYSVTIS